MSRPQECAFKMIVLGMTRNGPVIAIVCCMSVAKSFPVAKGVAWKESWSAEDPNRDLEILTRTSRIDPDAKLAN